MSNLKQSIVVVNEFSNKDTAGGRNTTPKTYIMDYMVRDEATERVVPSLSDMDSGTDNYIMNYMTRASAVEHASDNQSSIATLRRDIDEIDDKDGVAFSRRSASHSKEEIQKIADTIQEGFHDGRTVLRTVLSFTNEYLIEQGIVDELFECDKNGDYRGHVDQLKLRMAIMSGMDKLSAHYDRLEYAGVIHTDKQHVHVHLTMMDMGKGNITKFGTQKGTISKKGISVIRRGIDSYLDKNKTIQRLTADIAMGRRNAVCHVKGHAHRTMERRGFAQVLLACLPKDKKRWRYNSNAKDMRRANAITKTYVTEVLRQPNSGYTQALQHIDEYTQYRANREGLDDNDRRKLYINGIDRIMKECVNGVYSELKKIQPHDLSVNTRMMDLMMVDYDKLKISYSGDPSIEFGYRLRSYSSRLNHHQNEYRKYKGMVSEYKNHEHSHGSAVLDFFKNEVSYNDKVMTKYLHFLSFLPRDKDVRDKYTDLIKIKEEYEITEKMLNDPSIKKESNESQAEVIGRKLYGIKGGRYVNKSPDVIKRKIARKKGEYETKRIEFQLMLKEQGLTYDGAGVKKELDYEFDDVKALDIHHLMYDFTYDIDVSVHNVENFVNEAIQRKEYYDDAVSYLEDTGQQDNVELLPGSDIEHMYNTAMMLRTSNVLKTKLNTENGSLIEQIRTISLNNDVQSDIEEKIRQTVSEVEF